MVYAGGGVILNDASDSLTRLVRLTGFPCTNTLMGLGGFPGTDPQFTGMLGMHGTYASNMAMQNCDALLAVGARSAAPVIGNPAHSYLAARTLLHPHHPPPPTPNPARPPPPTPRPLGPLPPHQR